MIEVDDISLRPELPEDEEFSHRVYSGTRIEELALTDWSKEQKDAFTRMQFLAQRQHYRKHYPGCSFQVILKGGIPAGRWYVDRWEREIRIVDIALLPEFRGMGIGGKLIGGVLEEASGIGKKVSIHVEQFNRALNLYRRLGFEPGEQLGVYVLMTWTPKQTKIE